MTRAYEILFILRPDHDDEQTASVIARYTDVIVEHQGTVIRAEKWAKRRLAYEIEGVREGIYIIMDVNGSPVLADEIDRRMKIDQEILRHMISRIDHVADAKSKSKESRPRTREARAERGPRIQAPKEESVDSSDDSASKDSK